MVKKEKQDQIKKKFEGRLIRGKLEIWKK